MISGLAPGSVRAHQDRREVDLRQRCDRQEREDATSPTRNSPAISSVVATGRSMKGREMFTARSAGVLLPGPLAARGLVRADAAAGLQAVLVAGHDPLAGLRVRSRPRPAPFLLRRW